MTIPTARTSILRALRTTFLSAVAAATAATTLLPAAGATALPKAIVSVGDSYISGEAGRWYGNSNTQSGSRNGTDRAAHGHWWGTHYHDWDIYLDGTAENDCHRSDVAQVRSTSTGFTPINVACSGAVTANVFRASQGGQSRNGEIPQADRLQQLAGGYDVELVTISIGGNDLGFADIISDCAAGWSSSSSSNPDYCHDDQQPLVDQRMPGAMADVGKAIDEVRAALAAAGNPQGSYRIVLQSYPSPIPRAAENRYPETGWSRLDTGGCPFWNEDSDWARDSLVDQISDNLAAVAASKGVEFLDLRDFLQGREVCSTATSLVTSSPSATQSEWVRFLVSGWGQGELQESFHPNAYAQKAMGTCLDALWAAAPGDYACQNVPGQGTNTVSFTALP